MRNKKISPTVRGDLAMYLRALADKHEAGCRGLSEDEAIYYTWKVFDNADYVFGVYPKDGAVGGHAVVIIKGEADWARRLETRDGSEFFMDALPFDSVETAEAIGKMFNFSSQDTKKLHAAERKRGAQKRRQ